MYLTLTSLPASVPLPLLVDPLVRVPPSRSSSRPPDELSLLVSSPPTFFASSHAEGWEDQQIRRLRKMLPISTSNENRRGWLCIVSRSIVQWLISSVDQTSSASSLFWLWRERSLEGIDLLHGGGERWTTPFHLCTLDNSSTCLWSTIDPCYFSQALLHPLHLTPRSSPLPLPSATKSHRRRRSYAAGGKRTVSGLAGCMRLQCPQKRCTSTCHD